ncbi:cytochrome P450 18a1 [Nephila pilipes]|uniref:Cytochrome P450 18a1 n=1 Tax=Nephila pilipes TaxID=299642 RepID=A0A8X6N089_NEPPI|nr:cytochrome P450 18a1 [Nephila pilipes]
MLYDVFINATSVKNIYKKKRIKTSRQENWRKRAVESFGTQRVIISETKLILDFFAMSTLETQLNMISESINSLPPVSLAIGLAVVLITIAYYAFKRGNLPPGPTGLPYLGYWPFMNDTDCHLKLDKLKNKYGDVFSFTCTGRLFINLGSIKAVREAFITKAEYFGERMSGFNLMNLMFSDGVAFIDGEPWKAVRKFIIGVMKERGTISIKNSIAGPLYDSVQSTIKDLKEKNGESVNLIDILTQKCNTNLRITLFGDIGATEEQIRKFNEYYAGEVIFMTPLNTILCGNLARYIIFPLKKNYRMAMKCHQELENILYEILEEHKSTYDEEHIRDIIDEYFKERDKRQSKGDPAAKYFTDKVLIGTLKQFVGDGVLSVAAFTSLLMKRLLENREEQDKIYKEIVEVVGVDRQPTIEDKSKLTYLNAFILESLRLADFFNFFPSQECTKETTLNGYTIPKGAVMLVNFYSSHSDPEVFEEPLKFDPSRYIQKEGKRRPELPISFGVGKRACLGEGFTMTQVFLFIATIVQNFRLDLPEGTKAVSLEQFLSGNFFVCAHPRDHK